LFNLMGFFAIPGSSYRVLGSDCLGHTLWSAVCRHGRLPI
jgi:hypothetical protein